jgi:phage terminase large subunit-like protein
MATEQLAAQPIGLDAAERVIRFVERITVHTKGRFAGKPFVLTEWQKDSIIRPIFGNLKEDGSRRITKALIGKPRKNGKSQECAGIALNQLLNDREPGAEVYSAAADKDQARLVFDEAKRIVEASPFLTKHCRVYRDCILVPETNSIYKVLSADAFTKHGLNPSAVIFDELHAQPNRELWDVLTTGSGTRWQPLIVAITTAGYDRQSICYEQYDYGRKVAAGLIDDPSFYFAWWGADEADDWTDENVWHKANPALGDFLSLDYLRAQFREAREIPARQNTFRQLHLNQWVQQSTRWIDLHVWEENDAHEIERETTNETPLHGATCYGGLDLSSVSDMTAWIVAAHCPETEGAIDVLAKFWLPEDALDKGANRDLYRAWADAGWLKLTPGNAIDYGFIRAEIVKDAERYNLVDMNIDRLFNGQQMAIDLADEGLQVIPMSQGFMAYAQPMREFERLMLSRFIHHGGNPILKWMADNVVVKTDPAGNLKPDKSKSQNKIDGIVALVMAIDRFTRHTESAYTSRGVIVV